MRPLVYVLLSGFLGELGLVIVVAPRLAISDLLQEELLENSAVIRGLGVVCLTTAFCNETNVDKCD